MSQKRRAVLIAGGVSPKQCHKRYAKNLAWWASGLTEKGFSCQVFHGDGAQHHWFSGSPITELHAVRDKTKIVSSIAWLLGAAELAVLLVSNHGSRRGFNLWGKEEVSPQELQEMFAPKSTANKIIIMGQCYGGIFGPMANENTVVVSAATQNQKSWACKEPPGSESYDEFLYQLGTALFGSPTFAPQPNPPTALSLDGAFHWAKAKDRQPNETPSIFDPAGIASTIVL